MISDLRASGYIQDKDRYVSVADAKKQIIDAQIEILNSTLNEIQEFDVDGFYFADNVDDIIEQKIKSLRGLQG